MGAIGQAELGRGARLTVLRAKEKEKQEASMMGGMTHGMIRKKDSYPVKGALPPLPPCGPPTHLMCSILCIASRPQHLLCPTYAAHAFLYELDLPLIATVAPMPL